MTERIQFVEMLEGRLNALHAVASDVDQKVVVHRASLETLKHERTALEQFRHELQQSHNELKQITQSMNQALAVRAELEQLAEYVNTHAERRALEKKELEAFDQRLLVLRGAVLDAEARMKALSTQEMQLAYLPRRPRGAQQDVRRVDGPGPRIDQKQIGLKNASARARARHRTHAIRRNARRPTQCAARRRGRDESEPRIAARARRGVSPRKA